MADFENKNEMIAADLSSVSEALRLLKKIDQQERKIFEYIKIEIKAHSLDRTNEATASQLKEFFDYISSREKDEVSLPNFCD